MRIPAIRGVIERRILVNFRVDPEVLAARLPAPFRPQLVNGWGMAGICLIRLARIRPWFVPGPFGLTSENAAHRVAVEWDAAGTTRSGVFIPRRDTSSRLNTLVGGKLFPGVHHHARFDVRETSDTFRVAFASDDGACRAAVEARLASSLPAGSVFASLDDASRFFAAGSLGYSVTRQAGLFDGLELRSFDWRVEPLAVERVESSFFDDSNGFPGGTVAFDSALLMRGIDHEWHGREPLCASAVPAAVRVGLDIRPLPRGPLPAAAAGSRPTAGTQTGRPAFAGSTGPSPAVPPPIKAWRGNSRRR